MRPSRKGSLASRVRAVSVFNGRVQTPVAVAAVCAALLAASGCGGAITRHTNATPPPAQPSTEASRAQPPPSPSGRVKVRYEDAHTPDAQRGRALMQNAKLLEGLAQHVEDTLVLPSDMVAVGKQCDAVN